MHVLLNHNKSKINKIKNGKDLEPINLDLLNESSNNYSHFF
jgi:hypothetical protein